MLNFYSRWFHPNPWMTGYDWIRFNFKQPCFTGTPNTRFGLESNVTICIISKTLAIILYLICPIWTWHSIKVWLRKSRHFTARLLLISTVNLETNTQILLRLVFAKYSIWKLYYTQGVVFTGVVTEVVMRLNFEKLLSSNSVYISQMISLFKILEYKKTQVKLRCHSIY